jgi:hypothetical protein
MRRGTSVLLRIYPSFSRETDDRREQMGEATARRWHNGKLNGIRIGGPDRASLA